MYEKLFEQSERLFKPFSDIWALQAQAAETLAKAHTTVMTDAWNQGVLALQNIPAQKSMEDVLKLQQSYWENMQGSLQEMFDSAQDVIMETNRKISAVLQQSSDAAGNATAKAVKSATPAKAMSDVFKKTMPAKKAAATKSSPIPKSAASASRLPVKITPSSSGKSTAKSDAKSDVKAESASPSEQTTKSH